MPSVRIHDTTAIGGKSWTSAIALVPTRTALIGRCVTLEPLDVKTLATNVEKRDRLRQNYGIFLLISA
jgi:hypothetical protein